MNRQAITDEFAVLQTKVCDRLCKKGVNVKDFRLFVVNQFSPGDCIPPPPASLKDIFMAITHHGLWDYFHYSPLVQIVQEFGEGDSEMEAWIQEYVKDLNSYNSITTIEHCIEFELDAHTDTPPERKVKHDPRYYCPMEWKTAFTDHSLQHLAEVWTMFSDHYLQPDFPLTALKEEHVRGGDVTVVWLVPARFIPQLIETAKTNTKFFRKYYILKVTVGDECVYEEVRVEASI